MQALTEYKKDKISIAAFGGLNHSDFTKAGEWYDMENLSDCYAPLLAPRKSRAVYATLPAAADAVLEKNGIWYFTQTGSGIYCYAPQGNNPFAAESTTAPLLIFESEKAYTLLEMGNNLLAVPRDGSAMAVAIRGGKAELLGYNEAYDYESMILHPEDPSCIVRVEDYAAKQKVRDPATDEIVQHSAIYRGTLADGSAPVAFTVANTAVEGGYYDASAASLLNIGFTYAWRRDDGSYYYFDHQLHQRFAPTQSFSTSLYFLGTDNRLYDYDHEADVATEITAPYIAIMFHPGLQRYPAGEGSDPQAYVEKTFPQLEEGDYIRLSVGPVLNSLYRGAQVPVGDLIDKQLLRVHRCFAIDPENKWGQRGWTHCLMVDYSAALADILIKKDLIYNSLSYNMPATSQVGTDVAADRGLQQLYPRFIRIEAPMPAITAPLEHNNRVWGANNANNEIKASAQGNFKNWDDYRSLVSDSYAVSVGSNGAFTASCVIGDYLFFFKEYSYTMVYGTRPANYCTNTCKECIGMSAQTACSLQVIGTNAYYMGTDGKIYRFNAQSAVCISAALGEERYTPLAAAHTNEKYYLLVRARGGAKKILVYHVRSGNWWVEDAAQCESLCNVRAQACALSRYTAHSGAQETVATDVLLLDRWDADESGSGAVEWWCESGPLGLESDYYGYLSRLSITFESEVGAKLELFARYDNESDYTPLASFVSAAKGTRSEYITLRRCAFVRLKIKGRGKSKIYRIAYLKTRGSEK